MNTENTRVTRKEAAELAGVSERTILRWVSRGLLKVHRPDGPWGRSEYDSSQVLAAAGRTTETLELPVDDTA